MRVQFPDQEPGTIHANPGITHPGWGHHANEVYAQKASIRHASAPLNGSDDAIRFSIHDGQTNRLVGCGYSVGPIFLQMIQVQFGNR
ncbi:hypothetical protein NPIL_554121 [Nephila pilipes]|uniref:Uncharacterized protein n=1 Tax=Nephila pilipes TaxID=299642 RepID=A0A8X6PJT3_NEPPI|nr:hypothetical protein NPIL_554121 [Nephila pilipes]